MNRDIELPYYLKHTIIYFNYSADQIEYYTPETQAGAVSNDHTKYELLRGCCRKKYLTRKK